MPSPKKVVVFIPAFNEGEKIAQVIEIVKSIYADNRDIGIEVSILVIDDGSTDNTVEAAEKAGADKIISHPRNLGLGAATRTGMQAAKDMCADIAVKLDGDLQHPPEDIEKAIRPILDDQADIVYGSRFIGKISYRMPLFRFLGNKFFTWLMRILTGWPITDAQTGLMVYSKKYLSVFSMPGNYNPPHQTLLDAYHKQMRYAEVPVTFNQRTTGHSFISFRYPFYFLAQTLRILALVNPLKLFTAMGIVSFTAGLAWLLFEINRVFTEEADHIVHDTSIMILIIFSVQCVFFGLLADIIINK